MTEDKLNTSRFLANIVIPKQFIIQFHLARLLTPSTDKHCSLDFEYYFCSGCLNVSQQQQFFSELTSPGRSTITEYELKNVLLATPTVNQIFFFFGAVHRN